jgi:Vitamin K-dependent gamma-carboxylase
MSRIHRALVSYVEDSARALEEWWDAFWFTPSDPTLLGVLRILTGLMLVYTHAVWGLALPQFFGEASWLNRELVRTLHEGGYTYSFWWLVSEEWIWPAHAVSVVVLAMFTVGFKTRISSILAFLVTVSYAYRVPEATFGLDQINAILTLYLAIGPSGRALSVDRWLALRRGQIPADRPAASASANLALRLINVHMCAIYFFAAISKLQGEAWWNGEAMWRAFANYEYQSIDMTWLAWHPRLLDLATHVSIAWELSFCVLIWRPRIRPFVLAGAVVLHVGIGACLGMWTFGLIMLVGCASFLPAEGVGLLVHSLARGLRRSSRDARPFSAIATTPPPYSAGRLEIREPALVSAEDEG